MAKERELGFWQSVGARLAMIFFAGWLIVLWFQGCLVPLTKDDMHREQEKTIAPETKPKSPR